MNVSFASYISYPDREFSLTFHYLSITLLVCLVEFGSAHTVQVGISSLSEQGAMRPESAFSACYDCKKQRKDRKINPAY